MKHKTMKNNNLKTSITIFSMLLCFGLFAQGPPGGGQGGRGGQDRSQREKPSVSKIMELLDTNNDNKIDKDEASQDKRGKISEDFDEIDANADGFVDYEELDASLNNRKPKEISAEKIIKQVDDNGDGTLNELEVAAKDKRQLLKEFENIDTNKDNELDLEELKAFYSKMNNKKRKQRD
ncbi:EF-hand domain-containing protein [Psychroserpens sp. AS72]|uniref:EF-hand domain-containing protein n=1 Tax=Psychroserpens sp. AS72 TaxID=3135775 RepID=UPI00317134E5